MDELSKRMPRSLLRSLTPLPRPNPPGCPSKWSLGLTVLSALTLSQVRLGVIVWEAALTQPLGAYVQQYTEQMQAVVGNPSLSVVVVCNKTDVVPCPLPQLAGAPAAPTPQAPRVLRPTPHAPLPMRPVCVVLIGACCWCDRAWRGAAVHRCECGERHESVPPFWVVATEPQQAALAD